MIARVALEIALRREFDYLIPRELDGLIEIGTRVKVPFGHREVMGCVTALVEDSPHTNLRHISKVIGKQSLVTPKVLKLARWIAEYYCCAPEIALKSVLPEAVRKEKEGWKEQLFVRAIGASSDAAAAAETPKLSKRQQEIWTIIQERKELPLQELLELAQTTTETIRRLEDKGLVEIATQISERDPYARENILPSQPLPLNAEQTAALAKIVNAMGARESAASVPLAEEGMSAMPKAAANAGHPTAKGPPLSFQRDAGSTFREPPAISPFFNKDAHVDKHCGWLPHWRQAGKLYFVTFRLNDSVAQPVLKQWTEEKAIWLRHHPEPWTDKDHAEYHERFT